MKKLDRLGWAAGISITAYGVRVGIRINQTAALSQIPKHLPFGWRPVAGATVDRLYSIVVSPDGGDARIRRFNLLYGDLLRLARTVNQEELFEALEADLRLFVAEHAMRRVFLHAGVVGWKDRAIVLPGRSYSGKSTLVIELVRAGAVYYLDEYAILDARGSVHPFAQPVSIRTAGDFKQSKRSIVSLGGAAGKKALPVGVVVLSRFDRDKRWRPRRLSPGRGLLELLSHTVSARRYPDRAIAVLTQVVSRAPVIKSSRGEARGTARLLLNTLDSDGAIQ